MTAAATLSSSEIHLPCAESKVRDPRVVTDKMLDAYFKAKGIVEKPVGGAAEPVCPCMNKQEAYAWTLFQTASARCARVGCKYENKGAVMLEMRLIKCPLTGRMHVYSECCCSSACRSRLGRPIPRDELSCAKEKEEEEKKKEKNQSAATTRAGTDEGR